MLQQRARGPPGRDVPRSAAPQIKGTTATQGSTSQRPQQRCKDRRWIPNGASCPGQEPKHTELTLTRSRRLWPEPHTIKPLTMPYQPALWTLQLLLRPSLEQSPNHLLMLAPFVACDDPGSLARIQSYQLCAPTATSLAPPMWREMPLEMGGVSRATCQGAPGPHTMHQAPLPPQGTPYTPLHAGLSQPHTQGRKDIFSWAEAAQALNSWRSPCGLHGPMAAHVPGLYGTWGTLSWDHVPNPTSHSCFLPAVTRFPWEPAPT